MSTTCVPAARGLQHAAACAAVTQPMRPENEEYAWLTLWMLADAAATSSAFEHEGSKQNVPTCVPPAQMPTATIPTVFARVMRIGEGAKGRMQASCGISACATSVRNPCCFAPVRAASAAAEPFANAERQTSVTHSAHNRTHSSGRNGSRAESVSAYVRTYRLRRMGCGRTPGRHTCTRHCICTWPQPPGCPRMETIRNRAAITHNGKGH